MGSFFSKKETCVITVGLDNAGKSTIINSLKPESKQVSAIVPTTAFHSETFKKGKVTFKVYDMGGKREFRDMWSRVLFDVTGIIFVVDSEDRVRIVAAKDELRGIVENPESAGRPVLLFANKMDLPGAMTAVEMTKAMDLPNLCKDRAFNVFASNGLTGTGLAEGIEWLSEAIDRAEKKKK